MFRSQFPDAPNLFSNYRRLQPSSLSAEFSRTWLISLIGIAMVIAGMGVLVWNEGRAVQTARSLEEGHSKVLIPETLDVVFEENNGKLVLLAGSITVEDSLEDELYGISIRAVKLRKKVQMYQWYETADQVSSMDQSQGGDHDSHSEITYSYDKGWFDYPIDALGFNNPMGHHNPEFWPVNSSIVVNQRVKLGGFLLGNQLKEKFHEFTPFTSDERPSNPNIKMHAGLYFHAKDVWEPDVGDVRVQFSYAGRDGEQVTIVGKQSGREVRPFKTDQGDELLFLHRGLRKATEVFQAEHDQNRIQLWLYRVFGWFVAFLGLNCVSSLLDILVDDSPGVRSVLVLGVTSLPFSFSLSLTLVCIGIGWVLYRPFLAVSLLCFASAPILLAALKIYQRKIVERRHRL